MAIEVNVDNYARAEVASQVDRFLGFGAVVDASEGVTVTVPDTGDRYLTVMVMDEDGYVDTVLHDPGTHELSADLVGGGYAVLIARILVDPTVADDVAEVNRLQGGLVVDAPSARPWTPGLFDETSYSATKKALLALGQGLHDSRRTFGTRSSVDPVRFLIGSAGGFGGLPEEEAYYAIRATPQRPGRYVLRVADVPVDGFWSVSVYDRDGYFDENPYDSYSINNVTAVADDDGAVTIHLGPEPDGSPNFLYVKDGWNYVARMYRPRASILDGTWSFPEPEALDAT